MPRIPKTKRNYNKRKYTRKSKSKMILKKINAYNVHSYKRWASPVNFTAVYPLSAYSNSFSFTLSEIRGASELTALYDQYMITGVKVLFQMINNPDANTAPFQNTTNLANIFPKLFYVRDYDDLGVEAVNDLRERNNVKCRILRPNSQISFFIRPALRSQMYLDGTTSANSPTWKRWIDCSTSQVPHYGVKFAIDFGGYNTQSDYIVRVEKIFYVKFKNVR